MTDSHAHAVEQVIDHEWVTFHGGELEGRPPTALCAACRDALRLALARGGGPAVGNGRRRTRCFQCYKAGLDRERALKAAGGLDTASQARFQDTLPFEPVNRARLAMLRAECAAARAARSQGVGRFEDRRRAAQIAARRALRTMAAGLGARQVGPEERGRAEAAAVHAAELQLPESWLPYVVAR